MDREEIVEAQVAYDPLLDDRPVRWREILSVLLVVTLSDVTVYRGEGFAGYAALFVGIPLLLLLGAPVSSSLPARRQTKSLWIVGGLIALLATKMVWCAAELQIVLGLGLLIAFALSLSGTVPYVLDIVVFPARMMLGGLLGLASYTRSVRVSRWRIAHVSWLSILLPLLTFAAFSVHPISSEGELLLEPLLQCDDAVVCEGVRAYLAQRHEELERSAAARAEKGWTAFQCADQLLQARLRSIADQLAVYGDPQRREAVLQTFHQYAYQWY